WLWFRVEKDKTPLAPFLVVKNNGVVMMKFDQVILSSCKMQTYKFPFDLQRCSLSFKSFVHSVEEMTLDNYGNEEKVLQKIVDEMRVQYEWFFENISISKPTSHDLKQEQSMVVYTFTIRRRSVLYVVNFILPVLFFLSLDFASFLMSDTGGDKLSFKITILLAVTVLQLLLNEILPSSSSYIPLITLFCIGVFVLLKISLLETICVMFLLERDQKKKEKEEKKKHDNGKDT
ncbi:hypothetical protein NL108_016837, partial [Boleophthalmus pectinirostris]